MRLETVAESFATYRAKVLPPDAPPVQVTECQRAFYAGVYFCLLNLMHNIGDDSTDEEQGIVELEKLKEECERFAAAGGLPLPHAEPPPPVVVEPPNFQTNDDAAVRPIAKDIGRLIGSQLPAGWGFTLLLFSFGPGGALSYILQRRPLRHAADDERIHQSADAMTRLYVLDWQRLWNVGIALLMGTGILGTAAIMVWRVGRIDQGRCLFAHDVRRHADAYTLCLPTIGFNGETTLACHIEEAVDWTVTVCDQWEFPHGRAEKG